MQTFWKELADFVLAISFLVCHIFCETVGTKSPHIGSLHTEYTQNCLLQVGWDPNQASHFLPFNSGIFLSYHLHFFYSFLPGSQSPWQPTSYPSAPHHHFYWLPAWRQHSMVSGLPGESQDPLLFLNLTVIVGMMINFSEPLSVSLK